MRQFTFVYFSRGQIDYIATNYIQHGGVDEDGKNNAWMSPGKNPAGALLYFRKRNPKVIFVYISLLP